MEYPLNSTTGPAFPVPPSNNAMGNLAQYNSSSSATEASMKREDRKKDDTEGGVGHMMSMEDRENPLNWPRSRKVFVSAVSFAFSFVV
jgi:hypothetical protein